jgi:monoamine oxidase
MGEALGPRLHLNRPLTKVAKDKEGAFHLTFENGTEVHADIVVLAIPCSVYEHIAFEDAIPAQKLEAIQKVEYGQNAKIITPLATLPTKTTGVVGDEVVSFFDDAQQLLTIYYTGKTSLFSPKTIADSYAQARPMIEMGFGSHCLPTMLPTHAEDRLNFSYDGPVGYSWPSDPYAKGTYSYIASGQEELLTATEQQNGETFKTLFAPTQGLYFVGEHASILSDIPGTMEAACESGERIARAILQKL